MFFSSHFSAGFFFLKKVSSLHFQNVLFYIYIVVIAVIVLMHLSAAIPGGSTSGKYGGIGRDLLTFVANVWPGTRALDHFCTSEARYTGKDPRDL